MAVERQFLVKLIADPSALIRDFQTVRGEAEKTFGIANAKVQSLLPSFKILTTAAAGVFGGLAVGAGAAIKAAQQNQSEQQRLRQILLTTGKATEEQVTALNSQADALERVGVVAGGNITVLQSQLATFDLQATTIAKLTPAILDYVVAEKGATATSEDFKSMTNGLAQALNGQFGALTRAGFVLDDTTKALISNGTEAERAAAIVDVLTSTYGGFNESLRETTEGQLIAFRNSIDKLKTDLGTALLPAFDAVVRVLGTFADFAARNSTVVGVFAAALGALSGAVLLLAGYLKVAAFQKRLMSDEFMKGIVTMRNSEGQMTRTGTAVRGLSSAFAGIMAAQAVAGILNQITGASKRLEDQFVETAAALNEFSGGTGSAQDAIQEFVGIAQQELRKLDPMAAIGGVVKFESFGREFQLLADGIKLDVEVLDRAFRTLLQSDPTKASQLVDALKEQLAVTDPSSRSFDDLTEAIARYEGRVRTALVAQGLFNDEQNASPVFKLTAGLNKLQTQTILEGRARLESVGALEKYNAAVRAAIGSTGGSSRTTAEAIKPLDAYTKVLKSAQGASDSYSRAQRGVRDSQRSLQKANEDLMAAQKALLEAQQGGTSGEIGDAQRAVAAAERGVTRSKFASEQSIFAVRDAERKLAEVRADGESTAQDIREAEIALAEAKLRVVDQEDEQISSTRTLEAAQRDLRIATEGLREGDAELVTLQKAVTDAQDAQTRAHEANTDAIKAEAAAVEDYRKELDLLATAILDFPKVAARIGSPDLVPIVPTPAAGGGFNGGNGQRIMPDKVDITVNSSVVNPLQVAQEIQDYLDILARSNGVYAV